MADTKALREKYQKMLQDTQKKLQETLEFEGALRRQIDQLNGAIFAINEAEAPEAPEAPAAAPAAEETPK